jgi:hypothetical protein
MVKSLERWIIRNSVTGVCDRNGYTHVVLTLYTYPITKSRTIIIDPSNLFSDIMYHYKTSKSGLTLEKCQKVSNSCSTNRSQIKFFYK